MQMLSIILNMKLYNGITSKQMYWNYRINAYYYQVRYIWLWSDYGLRGYVIDLGIWLT